MQESTEKFKNEELILRDYLAIERTKLATYVPYSPISVLHSIFSLPESVSFRSKYFPFGRSCLGMCRNRSYLIHSGLRPLLSDVQTVERLCKAVLTCHHLCCFITKPSKKSSR